MSGPLPAYRAKVAEGELQADPRQQVALEKLQVLWRRLDEPEEARKAAKPRGFFGFGRKAAKPEAPLMGLYLWGGVGRGKSMLMDLFFADAPPKRKKRQHFHAFMQDVHRRLRAARGEGVSNPLPHVAREIAKDARLLCFDEMQVTDVGDAMILGRLFQTLFSEGTVIVTTSNREPDDLYKDGINRDVFVPFIKLIKERMDVLHLDGATDHRLENVDRAGVWHAPLSDESRKAVDDLWRSATAGEAPETVRIERGGGRAIELLAAEGAARAGFADLCERPLGAGDYLEIAERFHTLVIDEVPVMDPDSRDAAKRFVTLIDALYEAKARLIATAEAQPDDLYVAGDGSFEFNRTASRLEEMRGRKYLRNGRAEAR